MQQNLIKNIRIIPANLTDYPVIQNLARFYVYDLSRYCGFISKDWAIPKDGLYECFDFKKYFEDDDKKAYLVKLEDGELVGLCKTRLFFFGQLGDVDDSHRTIIFRTECDTETVEIPDRFISSFLMRDVGVVSLNIASK